MNKLSPNVLVLIAFFFCLSSCTSRLSKSLELAGENGKELEKVLNHFEDDPNPLKYEAAKFLIENMPYHCTMEGKGMKTVDSAYLAMVEYPIEQREKVFKELTKAKDSHDDRSVTDINAVSADHLIKVIDEACDLWHEVAWNNDYDTSLFFDYVLPYRLLDEPLSDWKSTVRQVFPLLRRNMVLSTRGMQMEAETLDLKGCTASDNEAASQGRYVPLCRNGATVSFDVYAASDCCKNLTFRYSATKRNARLCVVVNGMHTDTLHLAPTNDASGFRTSRSGHALRLRKGANRVSACFAGDTIGIDYIQTGAMEECDERKLEDYSLSYCMIRNSQNGATSRLTPCGHRISTNLR